VSVVITNDNGSFVFLGSDFDLMCVMSDRTHWATLTYNPYDEVARWVAFLPPPRGNPEGLIRLVLALRIGGAQRRVPAGAFAAGLG
jgi:hypothetical protein